MTDRPILTTTASEAPAHASPNEQTADPRRPVSLERYWLSGSRRTRTAQRTPERGVHPPNHACFYHVTDRGCAGSRASHIFYQVIDR